MLVDIYSLILRRFEVIQYLPRLYQENLLKDYNRYERQLSIETLDEQNKAIRRTISRVDERLQKKLDRCRNASDKLNNFYNRLNVGFKGIDGAPGMYGWMFFIGLVYELDKMEKALNKRPLGFKNKFIPTYCVEYCKLVAKALRKFEAIYTPKQNPKEEKTRLLGIANKYSKMLKHEIVLEILKNIESNDKVRRVTEAARIVQEMQKDEEQFGYSPFEAISGRRTVTKEETAFWARYSPRGPAIGDGSLPVKVYATEYEKRDNESFEDWHNRVRLVPRPLTDVEINRYIHERWIRVSDYALRLISYTDRYTDRNSRYIRYLYYRIACRVYNLTFSTDPRWLDDDLDEQRCRIFSGYTAPCLDRDEADINYCVERYRKQLNLKYAFDKDVDASDKDDKDDDSREDTDDTNIGQHL